MASSSRAHRRSLENQEPSSCLWSAFDSQTDMFFGVICQFRPKKNDVNVLLVFRSFVYLVTIRLRNIFVSFVLEWLIIYKLREFFSFCSIPTTYEDGSICQWQQRITVKAATTDLICHTYYYTIVLVYMYIVGHTSRSRHLGVRRCHQGTMVLRHQRSSYLQSGRPI